MRYVRSMSLVIVVGVAAYFGGNFLGEYLLAREEISFKAKRAAVAEAATVEHIHLGVGDTLPAIPLQTLDGREVRLDSLVQGAFYLASVHPSCGTCVDEMAEIAYRQDRRKKLGSFVFITAANPREMEDVRDSLGLENPFLYDHRGRLLYQFGLDIFPLFLLIDEHRCIRELVLGSLLSSEIEEAITESEIAVR